VSLLRAKSVAILGILVAALCVARARDAACAESDWPHWRGPTGNGASLDGRPPVEFGETKNLQWKVEIPGKGTASPVVMGPRVYVATAIPADGAAGEKVSSGTQGVDAGSTFRAEGAEERERPPARAGRGEGSGGRGRPAPVQRFTLLAIDRATGKILWTRVAAEVKPHEGHHPSHGFASASPFTDGERVYAHFGSRGLFCYDLEGKEVWKRTDFGQMRMRNGFGEGSSPTLHGDTIVVPWDHEGPSCLMALDKRTGKTLWKTDRDEPSCWATPLVVVHDGKAQVAVSGERFARGYDFSTGEELWRCAGQTARPLASPVAGHGLVFIGSGHQGNFLGAFRLDRRGDLQGTDGVVWTIERDTPDVPSPLLSGRRLYFLAGRRGSLSCLDAPTKKPHYAASRVEGIRDVYASPVAGGGKVYLTSRDGTIVVIEDADELKIAATNRLDEGVDATPAIAGSQLFVRGQKHLYCFSRT
jgi:outer membrane protein assembly factor BamB